VVAQAVVRAPNLVATVVLLVWGAAAAAAGDAEEGQRIAEKWCARCRVIGAERTAGGIDSTPSFFLMRERLDAYRDRILSLDQRRPRRALEFDVGEAARNDLISYIAGLERPRR